MSKASALKCKELAELLSSFYKLEQVEGSKFQKRFTATDKDLKTLAPDRQVIRDTVMDCFRLKGDAELPITENTLPKNVKSQDLATASLHQTAKALETRHNQKSGAEHLTQAKQLLKRAQREYAKKNPSIQAVDVVGACSVIKTLAEPAAKAIQAAKKTHKQVRQDTAARNARLDAAISHEVKNAPFGKFWSSDQALADEIWEKMGLLREKGEGWHSLTNKDLLSKKLGWQTVVNHVQDTNVLNKYHKKG